MLGLDPEGQIINDPIVREAYLASTFRGDEFDVKSSAKRARATTASKTASAPEAAGATDPKRP